MFATSQNAEALQRKLAAAGLPLRCAELTDRHLAVWGRLP